MTITLEWSATDPETAVCTLYGYRVGSVQDMTRHWPQAADGAPWFAACGLPGSGPLNAHATLDQAQAEVEETVAACFTSLVPDGTPQHQIAVRLAQLIIDAHGYTGATTDAEEYDRAETRLHAWQILTGRGGRSQDVSLSETIETVRDWLAATYPTPETP